MTKQEYKEYEAIVASNMKGVENISSGGIVSCYDCFPEAIRCPHCGDYLDSDGDAIEPENLEPYCSSVTCEICGDPLQGNRYPVHGIVKESITHFEACEDCIYYLEYGRLPDTIMDAIGK